MLEVQIRRKSKGINKEYAKFFDAGFCIKQSHHSQKTGNYHGEIFILNLFHYSQRNNVFLATLTNALSGKIQLPTMIQFLIILSLNAISLHQITAIQSLSFISALIFKLFPSRLLTSPNITQFRPINFLHYSHNLVPIYFLGTP